MQEIINLFSVLSPGRGVFLAVIVVLLHVSSSPSQANQPGNALALGQVVDVTCSSDSTQSYAVYLPTTYSSMKRWPIIYFFDPGGRGRRPLDLYKDIAETHGFIFAGSNNSRNFGSDESRGVNAIWLDTHSRFSVDEHRIYASGFSGGARVAGAMALSCSTCQIAGVIAHGAGYPNSKSRQDNLLYFLAVGDRDFNWPEVTTVRREREERGAPYRERVFSGPHQWAPREVMEDAVEWTILRSMRSGQLALDATFVDRILQKTQASADDAEKRNDAIAEFLAYRSLVSDFSGLKDTSKATSKLAALKESPALKAALKSERDQILEQRSLEQSIEPKLSSYLEGSAEDMNALRADILQAMGGLKDQAEHSKNESKRLVAGRAYDGILVEAIESGQQELEARHFERAENCFQLMSEATSDPWPVLLLAETHASSGNKKLAIKDLQEAVRRGLKNADAIDSDKRLEGLRSEPEYQKLLAAMKSH